jgi:hypothetical protein
MPNYQTTMLINYSKESDQMISLSRSAPFPPLLMALIDLRAYRYHHTHHHVGAK